MPRNKSFPAFATGEEIMLTDFLSLRMVGEKNNLYLLILAAQKTGHPEEEAAGAVFFK